MQQVGMVTCVSASQLSVSPALPIITKGDTVWFDPDVGYFLPGVVVDFCRAAQVATIEADFSGQKQTFTIHKMNNVRKREELGESGVDDMVKLGELSEGSILWNLKIRYEKEIIYTFIGNILVAVNPYQVASVYGLDAVKKYKGQILGTLSPHLFAVANSAYTRMTKENEHQAFIISGESGAGKTETSKLVMQYLAAVNKSVSNIVTEQILEASPLLESFGNAKTVKNNNSSRFGKYLEVFFRDGIICGAKTTEYLLEKSRIVTQALEERNYHVFYELLAGLSEQEKEKYGLQSADKYFYLNQGGSCEIEGKNDEEDFRFLLSAMQVLGFTNEEQDNIFRLLSAVLHLGNVYFHRKQLKHGQEGVEIGSDAEVRWISHLLQLPLEGILKAITFRTTETRNERVYTALNIDQALDSRDALAKSLYASLFSWLVHRVNNLMSVKGSKRMTLALLDIFGFEEFKENSFEQLCINFANETLHFYFTKYVFKIEQQEYVKEKIEWQHIPCPDNQNVLNLISKKPEGILPLLDDESNFPKATDHSFLEKCHYNHALSDVYSRPRMSSMEFGIRHYAGQVWYTVDAFLDKNRDTLRSDVLDLLSSSRMSMIAKIFSEMRNSADSFKTYSRSDGRFVTMKPRAPTVATRFQDSLATLLDTMSRCNPWFVRCIKPNNEKAAMKFDIPVVLQQLRYSGVLETVRIRQLGYTVRLKFQTFVSRYRCLLQGRRVTSTSNRDLCKSILQSAAESGSQYQLGQTKVFLRESVEQELETARARILRGAVVTMQKYARGYLTRKRLSHAERSAILIQSVWRGFRCRRNYLKIQKGVARAQATWKMHSQRKQYNMEKQLLARRRETQRLAAEKAKREQERAEVSRKAADRLPVPSQLVAIFEQLDDWNPSQTDKNIVKSMETPAASSVQKHLKLPRDVDAHSFAKFTNIYFRTHVWGAKSDPIETPFLSKSNDADFHQSLSIFKLILRYQNDNTLSGLMAKTIADYIIQKGLSHESLRDEILCQLCNQTWKNESPESAERAWILMANVLSAFPPSRNLFKYILQYVSEHAPDSMRAICQNKLLRSSLIQPQNVRTYPPTLLEHTANSNNTSMALEANLPNGDAKMTSIDSWSTGEEFAADLLKSKSIKQTFGWSVDLLDGDDVFELNGTDYVLDLISETEMPPSFPTCRSFFLTSPDRSKHRKTGSAIHDAQSINAYDPDLLDEQFYGKDENMEPELTNGSARKLERGSVSHEELAMRLMSEEYCILSNSVQSLDRNNMSLSKQSRLNQRYLSNDKGRSGHKLADKSRGSKRFISRHDHKSQPSLSKRSVSMQELGLATSALNDRYFYLQSEMQKSASVTNQHNGIDSAGMLKPANDRCFLESDYLSAQSSAFLRLNHANPIRPSSRSSSSTISSEDVNVNGDGNTVTDHCSTSINARYVKYPGKQNGRHSHAHSTKAYIDKSDRRVTDGDNYSIGLRSSAMSDTSEAPSLASHVRNVKIPSHMSELDQYLDDLFNPVLDGGLDELSDARSLAASIKGGSGGLNILTQVDVDLNGLQDLTDESLLSDRLKGGGVRGGAQQVQSSIPFPGAKKTSTADDSNMGNASSAFTNVAGMTVPIVDTSQVIQHQLVHQQMIQRAFLASAVQQNLQMQQKLLEQNEALQKILQGNPPDENSLSSLIQDDSGISSSNFTSSTSAAVTDSALTETVAVAGSTSVPPPPPPPPPPSPPPLDGDPFQNVYGRAKTVRIGKWRWPPPREDGEAPTSNSFLEFKLKKHQEKSDGRSPDEEIDQQVTRPVQSSNQLSQISPTTTTSFAATAAVTTTSHQTNAHESKEEIILLKNKLTKSNASANRISKAGSASNLDLKVDANVGKLRISSEMKAKLEQLTIDQSVRSGKPSGRDKLTRSLEDVADAAGVRKLSEQRKSLLEQQLLGSMRLPGIGPPSAKPIEAMDKVMHRSHEAIAPEDGLVRIEGRFSAHRRSMNRESRERRDELGPRGPATIASTVKAECGDDDVSHTLSDNLFFEDGTSTRNGSIYGGESIDSSPRKSLFCADSKNQQQQVKRMGIPPPPPPASSHHRPDQRPATACSSVFNGTVTPLVVRKKDAPPLPSNIRSLSHEHLTSHKFGESDFLSSAAPSTTTSAVRDYHSEAGTTRTKLFQPSDNIYLTYSRVNWELRLRKEVFYPGERIDDPVTLNLIFCQIVRDAFCKHMIRLCREDRDELQAQLRNSGVTIDNIHSGSHKLSVQRDIIEFAKDLPTYFCRFYPVTGGRKQPNVNLLGLSHSGLRFVQREKGFPNDVLKVIDALSFDGIADIAAPKRTIIQILLRSGGWITLYTPKAYQIRDLLEKFVMECHKAQVEFVRAIEDHSVQDATLLSFRKGDVIRIVRSRNMHISKGWFYGVLESGEGGIFPQDYVVPLNRQEVRRLVESMDESRSRNGIVNGHYHESSTGGSFSSVEEEIQESSCWVESKSDHVDDSKSDGTHSSNLLQDGKFSLLQFALFNFKEALEKYELVRNRDGSLNVDPMTMMESLKSKKKKKKKNGDGSDWTWKELSDLVKFSPTPISSPLLKLTSNELNKLAVDCFLAIMRYMGDHPLAKNQTEVDCVYTVLVNCHRYPQLRDEVFCQIMKQTTSNKSQNSESCRRGWRLFAIIAAYFDCSENLRPYLFKHLETAAYDKRRAYHGMAVLTLTSLRKTFRFGGRKNVPSIEEIAAISAGRNSKRQMYRLPGGTERIVNTSSTTVVQDVIEEICGMLGVSVPLETEEFSLYCIVEGDPYTMPLNRDEYILDVTTELLKNGQVFYLIFCRSVWFFPLRLDSQLYIEVVFNQVAPDYLEGLLLVTPNDKLPEECVPDIARVAALLHRAADMEHTPTRDEVKFLLPKPVLPLRDIKPGQWVEMVQANWQDMSSLTTTEAKAQCLDILQKWPLFGSCFFAIKLIQNETLSTSDHILALNRDGVHFLDVSTHENAGRFPYAEVISTRKVRAEDGTLYLDMKCGNLMVQRITRIQTDQAHEISRLIRQYIDIQSPGNGETPPNGVTLSRHPHQQI